MTQEERALQQLNAMTVAAIWGGRKGMGLAYV